MSINANGSIKELRVGSQVIKEARVGATVVYSASWLATPSDGAIFVAGRWGTGIGHSNISVVSAGMSFAARQPGTITGVVFSPNTTRLALALNLASQNIQSLTIDGITMTQVSDGGKNKHYEIPESMRTRTAHTIIINPGNSSMIITSLSFDV